MNSRILINALGPETRIALTEDDQLVEIFFSEEAQQRLVGNIYLAKVTRVVEGMQAAFVDLGEGRTGFLYVGDVVRERSNDEDEDAQVEHPSISSLLQPGDSLLVQVIKEALGTKRPRVSNYISFPGRYIVFTPETPSVGISRRITSQEERDRLKAVLEEFVPEKSGVIARTAASGVDAKSLREDFERVFNRYLSFQSSAANASGPCLLFEDEVFLDQVIRDVYSADIQEIVIDDADIKQELSGLTERSSLAINCPITLYHQEMPLFEQYGVETQIARGLSRRVWLPSGGYLVIEQTEALTSFDVNSGRFIGKETLGQNILRVNSEAAHEIARQLRLRNIGGIIVIDFIDMQEDSDKVLLNEQFENLLVRDRARTRLIGVNELGLMELTRKRTAESLERSQTIKCQHCSGTGRIPKPSVTFYRALREIEKRVRSKSVTDLTLHLPADYEAMIIQSQHVLDALRDRIAVAINVKYDLIDPHLCEGGYKITG